MTHTIDIRKSYKYRLYRNDKKDRKLRHMICVVSTIWNHFIALQRRYYGLTGKYFSLHDMNVHVLKLRKRQAFALWKDLHSQACQEVCRRVDDAYQRFFNKLAKGRPKFRKAKKYRSFTFPQSGYKLVVFNQNQTHPKRGWRKARGTLQIKGIKYKFIQHRPLSGQIKTLTVKRDSVGRLWLVFSVVEKIVIPETSTGKSGGFDFGLKDFLVNDEGKRYPSPQFYKQELHKTKQLSQALSRKVEGSNGYKQARRVLAKHQARIANKRQNHHFELAHELCDDDAILNFEDLNLQGMKARWGRKVSDLGFGKFMAILEWVAFKRGKTLVEIDRFTSTTKLCSACGRRHPLTLRDRTLTCPCGLTIDRDHNAALNIKHAGTSACYQNASQTQVRLRRRVDGSSPRL